MQLEATDCGAACLGIVLAHFGCWVSLEELRDECGVGRDGSTLEDIAVAARKYGLEATGWRSQI
ncbi:MAG: cysteine peptidase family C39 domain-containing protein, partial [Rhodospirillaceae bacterium]|nr:cysteine peptidase family C39 domain-containing protein [Rhodospirillaceae bacterium]